MDGTARCTAATIRASLAVLAALAGSAGAPPEARAQAPVDRARAHYEQAELSEALEVLDEAAESGGLDRAQLARSIELRVLVHLARGDDAGVDRNLERLASLAPDWELGPEIPPELRQRFRERVETSPGRVRVRTRIEPGPTGAAVVAEVDRDPTGLVREVRVHARVEGGPWRTATDRVEITTDERARVELHTEAIGPGGAVVARAGSRANPQRETVPAPSGSGGSDDDAGPGPWLWVGVGAGAAAVLGLVVGVAVAKSGGSSPGVQPSAPMVEF